MFNSLKVNLNILILLRNKEVLYNTLINKLYKGSNGLINRIIKVKGNIIKLINGT